MKNLAKIVALGIAVSAPVSGAVSAQTALQQPSGDGPFSTENLVGGLVRILVTYARLVAEVRYESLQIDANRGALVMRDLELNSIGGNQDCRASVGQILLTGYRFWGAEETQMRMNISDLSIANNCFGPRAAMIGIVTGRPEIMLQSLSVDSYQETGSGKMITNIEAVSPEIARIDASADFDYFSVYMPYILEELSGGDNTDFLVPGIDDPNAGPDPETLFNDVPQQQVPIRAILRSAHVSAEDLGIWERIQPMLPPDALSPDAIEAQIVVAPPETELHDFQLALAEVLQGFLADPGRVTVEIRPDAPIEIDGATLNGAEQLISLLDPRFSNTDPSPSVDLIASPDAVSDPLALGLALAEGRGIPQDKARAIDILSGLDDPVAVLKHAELIADTDPAGAYLLSLQAAEAGAAGAVSLLDLIETRLTADAIIGAQNTVNADLPEDVFSSIASLRDAALVLERGEGTPRNYAQAWRLAASAAAAGDGASRALMFRLDTRFGRDPAWPEMRDRAGKQAMSDWQDRDLAVVLAGQSD
ncbi:hypothetical protein [Paracoccus sp. SCSIO 75233]|uniref:hypothetical protein n=1 Tax=Paracoccus sp. SCSIO 75233 TaxID=3017782 RepID=UPI0022F11842|nr:hypothetical protein [Paracoccus sp. SCSIO 75233]WBU52664.1 hypothetical protein PAF12_12670 [Paracoccus sp. SCSIO 75233]